MTGKVRPFMILKPAKLNFGTSLIRGIPFPTQSVMVQCNDAVGDLKASSNQLDLDLRRISEKTYRIGVTPKPNLMDRILSSEVVLHFLDRRDRALPDIFIPVEGIVTDDIQAVPPNIVWGARTENETLEETILLQSVSGCPFTVERIELPNTGDLQVLPVSQNLQSKRSQAFRISTKVKTIGEHRTKICFVCRRHSADSKKSSKGCDVEISYKGLLPK